MPGFLDFCEHSDISPLDMEMGPSQFCTCNFLKNDLVSCCERERSCGS
ncbi:hypothetical protein SLEP1_g22230 [Rubroshorea leprosula]|uniref:Uncharacterized protein n=1 Tax=Rubroshorea leprosula TaxID=152421 RepID=A0AAV5JDW0_9ROSI|nr:hypothetical protein SLEP1_g22230 [Rubroshorea leprosula]